MGSKTQKSKKADAGNKKVKLWPIVLLAIVAFLYYGNSIQNGFSLDDDLVTKTDNASHPRVEKGIKAIPEIFTTKFVETSKQSYDYRPIVTSSFAIEYSMFGSKTDEERASISHFINILLYILILVLVYLLIYKLFPDSGWLLPLTVAVLFLIHPIHTEVVNNIKCRDELLVMIFGIGGMLFMLAYVDTGYKKWKYLLFAVLFVLMSILSKRVGITYVVLIPLVLYFFRDLQLKKVMTYLGILVISIVIFALLKKVSLEDNVAREKLFFENPLYHSHAFMDRIPMFFYSIMFYLKMMILPIPLVYYYGYDQIEIVGWENPFVWLGVLIVIGGVVLSLMRLKKKEVWVFGFLYFMFAIGGAANLLFPAVGIVAERFVFTASLGFVIPLAYYALELYKKYHDLSKRMVFYGVGGGIVLVTFLQVTDRNKDWNSRFSLYKNDIVKLKKSAKAHSLLGVEYTQLSNAELKNPKYNYLNYMAYVDSAISQFEEGLAVYDGYYNCANNAGAMYFSKKNDHFKAKPLLYKALEHKSDYVEALFNLGNCYERDLLSIDVLLPLVDSMSLDSAYNNSLSVTDISSDLIKSAFAMSRIQESIQRSFNKINLAQENWQASVIARLKFEIEEIANTENAFFRKALNEDFYKQLSLLLYKVNASNANEMMKAVVAYINQYFNEILKEELVKNNFNTDTGKNRIHLEREAMKDSLEKYWNKSLEFDPGYINTYRKYTAYLAKEKNFEKLIDLNNKAINEGEFKDNTEFLLNIANSYNGMLDVSKAIEFMEKALTESDRVYAVIYEDEKIEQQLKNQTLTDLYNRKKQILGFIANLYLTKGDQETYLKYLELSQQ